MTATHIPRTPTERAAHLAHVAADLVLPHPVAQAFSFSAVQTLLAISRGVPEIDPTEAQALVRHALAVVLEVEIRASRSAAA